MSSKELFDAALGLFESAAAQGRAELAQSEVRVAKLKAADALFKAGRHDEAQALIAEVRAEQEGA